ncbi:ABC transporter permease subunit [Streptomyces sp. DW26H14]|uniref:ABC transporter permease subunit n=1 Tax=Streptomyces sp. DW26H14 TaxID=3435395 RepID=UPI00403DDB24
MLTATSSVVGKGDTPPAVARKKKARNLRESALVVGLRIGVIVLVLVLWQVMSGPVLPEYAVSRPTSVAVAVWDLLTSSAGWTNIETTAVEVAAGFVIGVAIGSVMGVLLGTFKLAGRVLEPLAAAFNGIPKIAIAPLFVLFFGLGEWSKIAIAVTGVAFIMFYNLYLGLRLVDRELNEIIRVMGGRGRHVLTYVTIPTLAPPFFAGLKAGGPLAILGVIGGEFIASFNGLGHLLFTDAMALDSAGVFAGLIVLVAMSLILNSLLTQLDNYVLKRLGLGKRAGQAQV